MPNEDLRELWKLAFGDSDTFIGYFFDTAYSPERCQRIVIGGKTAAALYWLDCSYQGQKLAYIYAVATHPEHQGKGLCRTLMAQTHAVLQEKGYSSALLMPAEPGLWEMYRKMGYRECCRVEEFSCPAGTPVSVREVDIEEYAVLRRKFLPADGVLQENENLRYLHTYARFYAGTDFLLAAVPGREALGGIELLGNRASAPGILAALGYEAGSFRCPGKEIPFAMFHPLKKDAAVPGYLGFAFD